jgi:YD repeat-containing protein
LNLVERNEEVVSTYTYGIDDVTELATLEITERVIPSVETLILSPDYQSNNQTVVNQFANILLMRKNGLGQVVSAIYADSENPGWYKVLHEDTMSLVKVGQSVRYYTSYTQTGSGFDGITGTLESAYSHFPDITQSQLLRARPPEYTDETGYTVENTYDSNGHLIRVDHPDEEYEKWIYNSFGQVTYYRDRAGIVTVTEYNGNHQPVRIVHGMTDPSGTGTPSATDEAIQEIFGYYGTSHTNEGMLAWTGTTPYSGSTFSAPASNDRTDFDSRGRLDEITYPSGRKAEYTFDERSAIDTIEWDSTEIEDRDYDDLGRLASIDRPGIDETRGYDDAGRLTSIANTNVGTATYTYPPRRTNHNKLSEAWSGAMADWSFVTTNGGTYSSGYDAEDRFRNFIQTAKSKSLYLDRSDIGNITNYQSDPDSTVCTNGLLPSITPR